jgi:hypothetical protein
MRQCLRALEPGERKLVVNYFRGRPGIRKKIRARLRNLLGITAIALKLRVHKIVHQKLRPCYANCLKAGRLSAGAEDFHLSPPTT